ncbi:SDR family oxidoreductase [Flavobacterium sp. F372]|uniref:SDR family oxidoreductase n=1 Tax=Flavobacterium bernardetii TaxID=2813823 RepID=A0ABR7IW26_9FLAO|nr:SDR family oxidoreductase [Flavobacterium bernardetii]MBC5833965.1 SDR family oxidoreductase [Flavobacterium bernardetii]NHF69197.1 SDR family oxidoreductase [Flavobacterium bernardetii]
MILVTGATGQLGSQIVENLLTQISPSEIAVLVRDEEKAKELKNKGVQIRIGEYTNPNSLVAAFKDVKKLILISSNDFNDRFGQHKNAIDAAKQTGVKHVIYTSMSMNDIETSPLKGFLEDHYQTEEYIKQSGFTYTMMQHSLYSDVIPMFIGEQVLETGVFFPAGEGRVAYASRTDLAEAISKIVVSDAFDNQSLPLTNIENYSYADVAEILTELSGKEVVYVSPTPEVFAETLKGFGLPEPIIQMSLGFASGIKNNDFDKPFPNLETILGRKPQTLKDYLQSVYIK